MVVLTTDSPPEMPEVEFGSRVVGNNGDTDPSGITFQWTMELSYDEGNYEDIAEDTTVTLTETIDGDTSWQPDFSRLSGDTPVGGNIEVTVNASQGQGQPSLSDTDVRDGYMIRGENPSSDTIVANTDNDWERAMVWQESGDESQGSQPEQFNEPAPGFLNVNLADNPPGWGLTQITHPIPNRLQVWNWFENLAEGIERLEECRSNAEGRNEMFYEAGEDPTDPSVTTPWDWDPTDPDHVYDGTHVDELQDFTSEQITSEKIHWLEAYFRYNSSVNSMFDPDGTFRDSAYGGGTWNEAWDHTFTYDESDGDLENSFYSTYAAEPWQ